MSKLNSKILEDKGSKADESLLKMYKTQNNQEVFNTAINFGKMNSTELENGGKAGVLNNLLTLNYKALAGENYLIKRPLETGNEPNSHPIIPKKNISQIRLPKVDPGKAVKNLNLKSMYSKFVTLCTPRSPYRRFKHKMYIKCMHKHSAHKKMPGGKAESGINKEKVQQKCPVTKTEKEAYKLCQDKVNEERKAYEYDSSNKLTEDYFIRLFSPSEISLFEECVMKSELTDEYLLNLVKNMLKQNSVIDQMIHTQEQSDSKHSDSDDFLVLWLLEKLGGSSVKPEELVSSFGKYLKQRLANINQDMEKTLDSEKNTDSLWETEKQNDDHLKDSEIHVKYSVSDSNHSASSESFVKNCLKDITSYPDVLDKFGCRMETYCSTNKKETVINILKRLLQYYSNSTDLLNTSENHSTIVDIGKKKEYHSVQLDKCKISKFKDMFDKLTSQPIVEEASDWEAVFNTSIKGSLKNLLWEKEEVLTSEHEEIPKRNKDEKYNLANDLIKNMREMCNLRGFIDKKEEDPNSMQDKKADGRSNFKALNFDEFLSFHKFLKNKEIVPLHSYKKKLYVKPTGPKNDEEKFQLDTIINEINDVFLELDATKYDQNWDDYLSSLENSDISSADNEESKDLYEEDLVLDLNEYTGSDGTVDTGNEKSNDKESDVQSDTLNSLDLQDVDDLFKKEDLDWLPYDVFDDPEFVIDKDEETSSSSTPYDSVYTFPNCDSSKDEVAQEFIDISDSDDTTTTESESTPHGPTESSTDPEDEWIPKGLKYDPAVKKAMKDKIWKLDEIQMNTAEKYLEDVKTKGEVKDSEDDEFNKALPWSKYIGVNDEKGSNGSKIENTSPNSLITKDNYIHQLVKSVENIYETYDFHDTACRTVPLQVLKNIHALSKLKGEDAIIAQYVMDLCMSDDLEQLDVLLGENLKVCAPVVHLVKSFLTSLHHPNFLYNDVILKIHPPQQEKVLDKNPSDASLIPQIRKLGSDNRHWKKRMKLSLRLIKNDENNTAEGQKISVAKRQQNEKKLKKNKHLRKRNNIVENIESSSVEPTSAKKIIGHKKKTCNDYMFSKNYENEKFSDTDELNWPDDEGSEMSLSDNFKESILTSIEQEFPSEARDFLALLDLKPQEDFGNSESPMLYSDGKMKNHSYDCLQFKGNYKGKKDKKNCLQLDGGTKKEETEIDWDNTCKETGVFNNAKRMEFLKIAYPKNYIALTEKRKEENSKLNSEKKKKNRDKYGVLPVVPLNLVKRQRLKRLSKTMGLVVKDSEIKASIPINKHPFGSNKPRGLDPIEKEKAKVSLPLEQQVEEEKIRDYVEEEYPKTEEMENFCYKLMTFYNPEKALKYLRQKTGKKKSFKDIMKDLQNGLVKNNYLWLQKFTNLIDGESYKPKKSCGAEVKQKYFTWKPKDVAPVIPGTNVQICEPQIRDLYEVEDAWGFSLPPLDYRSCGLSNEALESVLNRMLEQDIEAVELAGLKYEKEFKELQLQLEKGLFKTPAYYAQQAGRLEVPREQKNIPPPGQYNVRRWPEILQGQRSWLKENGDQKKVTVAATIKTPKKRNPIKERMDYSNDGHKTLRKGFQKSEGLIHRRLTREKVFCLFCTFPVNRNYYYIADNHAICYECFKREQVPLEDYMEERQLHNVKAVRPGYSKVKHKSGPQGETLKKSRTIHEKLKQNLFRNRFINSYHFGGFIPDTSLCKAAKNNKTYKNYQEFNLTKRGNLEGEVINYYQENAFNLKENKEFHSALSTKEHVPGSCIKLWRNMSIKPM